MDEQKQKTIGEMTSEELGLALNQQYQVLQQAQMNIVQINSELNKRKTDADSKNKQS